MRRHLDVHDVWCPGTKGQFFIPLGNVPSGPLPGREWDRIQGATRKTSAVWGTFGPWANAYDATQRWQGELSFSRHGNDHSSPEDSGEETCRLIQDVRATRLDKYNQRDSDNVRERYVDLSRLHLLGTKQSFSLDQEEAARLTLFLEPGEGALVFLQNGRDGEGGVTLIQPEKVPNFDASERDRLTYRIPLWSYQSVAQTAEEHGHVQVQLQEGIAGHPYGTSIKILTFQRGNSVSSEVLGRASRALRGDKYQLLAWDAQQLTFAPASAGVLRDKKTLLFLHGTFSSTKGSFGKLSAGGKDAWLAHLLQAGRYEQVLALEHDTVFDSLEANAAQFKDLCGGGFALPLDVVTQSRGGLLAKHLALYEPGFEIERAALVACANGVGYFRAARHISRLLTVLRHLSTLAQPAKWAVALAQHSAAFVLTLDGLRPMHPGSEELQRVAEVGIPQARTPTIFRPIAGDWDKSIIEAEIESLRGWRSARWKRWGAAGLDLILRRILGPQHDWVVGTKEQGIVAEGHLAPGVPPDPVLALHTNYYGAGAAQVAIAQFLRTGRGS